MERDAVRDFVADSTPDMQEAIDAARERYGDEQFDAMVAEVLRRANDPDRETPQEEAERLAREQLEHVHEITGNPNPVTDGEVQEYIRAAGELRYTDDLEELAEVEELEELDDDVLLDVLGSGDDPDEGELADMLGAWRDDVESVPPSPGTAPETVQQIHDFTQEIDRATAPPRTTEGATAPMSLSEVIARLQMVAHDSSAEGPLAQAKAKLESEVLPLLQQAVEMLVEIKNTGVAALEGNVNTHAELLGAAEHAAGSIEDAIALTQQAISGAAQAGEHEAAFRQTALDIAGRLSSG